MRSLTSLLTAFGLTLQISTAASAELTEVQMNLEASSISSELIEKSKSFNHALQALEQKMSVVLDQVERDLKAYQATGCDQAKNPADHGCDAIKASMKRKYLKLYAILADDESIERSAADFSRAAYDKVAHIIKGVVDRPDDLAYFLSRITDHNPEGGVSRKLDGYAELVGGHDMPSFKETQRKSITQHLDDLRAMIGPSNSISSQLRELTRSIGKPPREYTIYINMFLDFRQTLRKMAWIRNQARKALREQGGG